MIRLRNLLLPSVVMLLGALLASQAEAQSRGLRRGSFLGIAGAEQVQKELKFSEEETEKIKKLSETLRKEMGEKYAELRKIEDSEERHDKMHEMRDAFEEKARKGIHEVITDKRMIRIYQIRLQLRGDLFGLNHKWIAGQLKLSDEVKKKLAELDKATHDKVSEAYSGIRELKEEERRKKWGEIREKIGKIRAEANKAAVAMLDDEQKKKYEGFKGEEFKIAE